MSLLLAFMIVVVALEWKRTKHATGRDVLPAFALLAWFGLVGRVDAVGGSLQQKSYHLVGRLEDGCAHQLLQFLHGYARRLLRREARHQLLDFGFLSEDDLGRGLLLRRGSFFMLMSNSARVFSMACRAYSWVSR